MEQKEGKKGRPKACKQTAVCPFCGQIQICEDAMAEWSEEELKKYAMLNCTCSEAVEHRQMYDREEMAREAILRWFDGDSDFIRGAMEIVRMVQADEMDSATLVSVGGRKLKISTSKTDGYLKVAVSQTLAASRTIR